MKSLGAVSKGAAESTGTEALADFEIGTNVDRLAIQEAWANLPQEVKEAFSRRSFIDYEERQGEITRQPLQRINPAGSRDLVHDFLLDLQTMPVAKANFAWDAYWDKRTEILLGHAGEDEHLRTLKDEGEVLRHTDVAVDTRLFEVQNNDGQRFGDMAAMVTPHSRLIRDVIFAGVKEKETKPFTWSTFRAGDQQVSGLKVPAHSVERLAKAKGVALKQRQHTPESALQDLKAGDHIELEGDLSVYLGQAGNRKGRIIVEGK